MSTATKARLNLATPKIQQIAQPGTLAANDDLTLIPWAGSKSAIVQTLVDHLPNREAVLSGKARYFEPFTGSGALALALLEISKRERKGKMRAVLGDANHRLAQFHQAIRDDADGVIRELGRSQFEHSKENFYAIKAKDRRKAASEDKASAKAARFQSLVSSCFRGVCRMNKNGDIGVSWGYYAKRSQRLDSQRIQNASALLRNAAIRVGDFEESVKDAKAGDVVYLDPPYVPLPGQGQGSFYSSGSVQKDLQGRIAAVLDDLTDRGVYWMISNSDTPYVHRLYGKCKSAKVLRIDVPRRFGERQIVKEVLAFNHPRKPRTSARAKAA